MSGMLLTLIGLISIVNGFRLPVQLTSAWVWPKKFSLRLSLLDTVNKPVGAAIEKDDQTAALTTLLRNAELEKNLLVAEKNIEIAKKEVLIANTEKEGAIEALHLRTELFDVKLKYEKEKSLNAVKSLMDKFYTYSARGILEFYNEIVIAKHPGSRDAKWKSYLTTTKDGIAFHQCMAAHNTHFHNADRLTKYLEGLWATMCDSHHLTKLDIRDGKQIIISHTLPSAWKDTLVCLCNTAPIPIKYRITQPGEDMFYDDDPQNKEICTVQQPQGEETLRAHSVQPRAQSEKIRSVQQPQGEETLRAHSVQPRAQSEKIRSVQQPQGEETLRAHSVQPRAQGEKIRSVQQPQGEEIRSAHSVQPRAEGEGASDIVAGIAR